MEQSEEQHEAYRITASILANAMLRETVDVSVQKDKEGGEKEKIEQAEKNSRASGFAGP
ncbi:MAG: hypothetical protein KGZ93_02180 [Actinobacteria bacterium]|nr:hypothetical protein [Actinomycetota bacterium]